MPHKDIETLKELLLIMKIANREVIERELSKVASTNERKLMWLLFDGKTHTGEIAKKIGKNKRTVQYFVNDLVSLGLVDPQRGFPKRQLDYVPAEWLKLNMKGEEKIDDRENIEQTE